MASQIETLLNTIETAIYGRDMRSAIHDSIEICYTDVSTAKTRADDAIAEASTATANANIAAANADDSASAANTAASAANTATSRANTATSRANTATNNAISATTAATNATTAATEATTAATNATTAAQSATTLANAARDAANEAASNATIKANLAESKAGAAEVATQSANNAATNATTAANKATTAANTANNATAGAQTATANANSAIETVQTVVTNTISATTAANNAATNATNATTAANTATANANTATEAANTAASEAITAKNSAVSATNLANTAAARADTAAEEIEQLSVTYEDAPYTISASASLGDLNGHKNIHFVLKQGNPGPGFSILGEAYATVADLEADITDPTIGDMYNVGAAAPYNVYRWNGVIWEDQGLIGNGIVQITANEVQTLINGNTLPPNASKALGIDGLTNLIQVYLVPTFDTKVDKVTGKGLSTNDFTNAYVQRITNLGNSITDLDNNKVNKVTGKGLSSNDFTTEYINLIQTLNTNVTLLISDKADKSATVSNVTYSTANKVINKTINGTTTEIVTAAQLKADMDLTGVTNQGIIPLSTAQAAVHTLTSSEYEYLTETVLNFSSKQDKHKTATAIVAVSDWNSSTMTATVNMTGVTADNDIIVTYGSNSFDAWVNNGIRCTGQNAGTITLTTRSIPSTTVTVAALIFD